MYIYFIYKTQYSKEKAIQALIQTQNVIMLPQHNEILYGHLFSLTCL